MVNVQNSFRVKVQFTIFANVYTSRTTIYPLHFISSYSEHSHLMTHIDCMTRVCRLLMTQQELNYYMADKSLAMSKLS